MSLRQLLESKGWSLSVETVDPGGYKQESKFKVTVGCAGQSYTTDYTSGWGNRVWRARNNTPRQTGPGFDYWAKYRKPGQPVALFPGAHGFPGPGNLKAPAECEPSNQSRQTEVFASFAKLTEPILPTLTDVLYALNSDAQSVCHGQTFEDFCADFGYDDDSRKAEGIFNACRDTWCALIRLGADFDELSELFQDY
jgi:hypothetical protein